MPRRFTRRVSRRVTRRPFRHPRRRMVRRRGHGGALRAATRLGANNLVLNPIRRSALVREEKAIYAIIRMNTTTLAANEYFNMFFDPSGTYSVLNPNPTTGAGSLAFGGITEWSGFQGLYDQYRVKKITVTGYLSAIPATPFVCNMAYRYQYDPNTTFTAAGIYKLPNVKVHSFSVEHQTLKWVIYPRVQFLEQNSGTLGQQADVPAKMKWTDTDFPARLYGGCIAMLANIPSGLEITLDVSYQLEFRYSV